MGVVNDSDEGGDELTDCVVSYAVLCSGDTDNDVGIVICVIPGRIECVGVVVSTDPLLCVVNPVATGGRVCTGVVTESLCVGIVL